MRTVRVGDAPMNPVLFPARPSRAARAVTSFLGATAAAGVLLAQSLSPAIDPVCGLPKLTLRGTAAGETYQVLGTDDLDAPGAWETLMQLVPGTAGHQWFETAALPQGRRFYRVERVTAPPALPLDDFALNDHRGVQHQLFREGDAKAVVLVFTDNEHLTGAWSVLKPLQEKFGPQGVLFWLINPKDPRASLAAAAAAAGVDVPVLHDVAQLVARTYQAGTALETVAVDNLTLEVFYKGPATDLCETPAGTVEQPYLAQALEQFTAQKTVVVQTMKARGKPLGIEALPEPSFARDIAPLVRAKCVTCHRPGDIGSWSMTNHATLADHSASMRRDILTGIMPPWHADPAAGKFANDSSLTPTEAARLVAWIDAGAKLGSDEDVLATQPSAPPVKWPLGQPDLVLSIPTQSIPASGDVDYRYLLIPNPKTTNVWLRAATVRPGNRQVVHHALVFSGANFIEAALQAKGGLGGYFAGYVPGMDAVEFPTGTGKLLKKGSYLVFQMHYTTTGTATTDKTDIGLYFAKTPPSEELVTVSAYETGFQIGPNAKNHEVVAETTLPRDAVLHEMSPHMHLRGRRMRFEAVLADGSIETLLNVPAYQFAWQTLFRLAEPKQLPAGTRIRVTGGFDNSVWNPWNPDPTQTVSFGDQTYDEMLVGYLNLVWK